MSIYIDRKFVGLVAHRLLLFKVKSTQPYQASFRCPFCGDSKKSETKTRGGIYEKNNRLKFHCFNCGKSTSNIYNFLKEIDPTLAKEYIAESFINDRKEKEPISQTKPKEVRINIDGLVRLDKIDMSHPVIKYVAKRKIPHKNLKDIYYVDNFNSWVNTHIPMKLKEDLDEPRLVFPFFDKTKKLFGVTGRSLKKDGLRYVTIMFDENENKIFGLDRVDFTKKYYIVEGAIDSFFLPNCIAMAGADARLMDLPNKSNAVVVFDNEPRNLEIHNRMLKTLQLGFKICIWPSHISQKDINSMVIDGLVDIQDIIDKNTYTGLMGESKLAFWKKARK